MLTPHDVRAMMATVLQASAQYAESTPMHCDPLLYLLRVTHAGLEEAAKAYPARLTCEAVPDVGTMLIVSKKEDGMDPDAANYFVGLVGAFKQAMQQFIAPLMLLQESTDPSTFVIVGTIVGRALRVMLQRTLDFDEIEAQHIQFDDVLQQFDTSHATPQ